MAFTRVSGSTPSSSAARLHGTDRRWPSYHTHTNSKVMFSPFYYCDYHIITIIICIICGIISFHDYNDYMMNMILMIVILIIIILLS